MTPSAEDAAAWRALVQAAGEAVTRLYQERSRFVRVEPQPQSPDAQGIPGGSHEAWQAMAVGLEAIRMLGAIEPDDGVVQRIRRMYAAIDARQPATFSNDLYLALIETAARQLSAGQTWTERAEWLGRSFRLPKAFVHKLADMLEHHYVAKGSGKVPKGRYTTPMIATWLTGGEALARHASRTGKGEK
jgi:hypothetical protein